jgi:uncharacterized protein
MRLFLLAVCALLSLTSAYALSGFVTDTADLFTPQEEAQLTAIAQEIYDSNAAQYAIVTTPSLNGQDIESYSIQLAQGQLGDTAKDNGLLLVIAPNERLYRFEVGSGLEGTLNDARVGRIGRTYLVPAFRQTQYGPGTIAASDALRQILVTNTEPQAMQAKRFDARLWFGIFALLVFMILVFAGGKQQRKKKEKEDEFWSAALAAAYLFGGRGGGGGDGGGFGGGGFSGGGGSGGW